MGALNQRLARTFCCGNHQIRHTPMGVHWRSIPAKVQWHPVRRKGHCRTTWRNQDGEQRFRQFHKLFWNIGMPHQLRSRSFHGTAKIHGWAANGHVQDYIWERQLLNNIPRMAWSSHWTTTKMGACEGKTRFVQDQQTQTIPEASISKTSMGKRTKYI